MNKNNRKYIFTITVGRSGQETLTDLLNNNVDNVHASFEEPMINTIFKGRLSAIEHHFRRKYIETNELLGRGKVLKAYDSNNISFINNVALKRIESINKKLDIYNKQVYIDVSKFFSRGLYIGFCNLLQNIQIINLVRDPLMNMKSFANRNKKFTLDNNFPDCASNILQLNSSSMKVDELYLWSWFETYLRFQYLKKSDYVNGYTEIYTEKLNDSMYMKKSLSLIGLQYKNQNNVKKMNNTNISKGFTPTMVSRNDVDLFYRFLDKIPLNLVEEIKYLKSYDPMKHIT